MNLTDRIEQRRRESGRREIREMLAARRNQVVVSREQLERVMRHLIEETPESLSEAEQFMRECGLQLK